MPAISLEDFKYLKSKFTRYLTDKTVVDSVQTSDVVVWNDDNAGRRIRTKNVRMGTTHVNDDNPPKA